MLAHSPLENETGNYAEQVIPHAVELNRVHWIQARQPPGAPSQGAWFPTTWDVHRKRPWWVLQVLIRLIDAGDLRLLPFGTLVAETWSIREMTTRQRTLMARVYGVLLLMAGAPAEAAVQLDRAERLELLASARVTHSVIDRALRGR